MSFQSGPYHTGGRQLSLQHPIGQAYLTVTTLVAGSWATIRDGNEERQGVGTRENTLVAPPSEATSAQGPPPEPAAALSCWATPHTRLSGQPRGGLLPGPRLPSVWCHRLSSHDVVKVALGAMIARADFKHASHVVSTSLTSNFSKDVTYVEWVTIFIYTWLSLQSSCLPHVITSTCHLITYKSLVTSMVYLANYSSTHVVSYHQG